MRSSKGVGFAVLVGVRGNGCGEGYESENKKTIRGEQGERVS